MVNSIYKLHRRSEWILNAEWNTTVITEKGFVGQSGNLAGCVIHPLGIFIIYRRAKTASAVAAVFAYVTRLFVRVCTAVSFFNWVDFLSMILQGTPYWGSSREWKSANAVKIMYRRSPFQQMEVLGMACSHSFASNQVEGSELSRRLSLSAGHLCSHFAFPIRLSPVMMETVLPALVTRTIWRARVLLHLHTHHLTCTSHSNL